jgi:hypothetical protein
MTRRIPDVLLERYRLKELPEPSMRAIDMLLRTDPAVRARLDELDESDAQIASEYSPRTFAHDVPAPPPRRRVLQFALAASVVLGAIVLGVALPRTPGEDGNRIKGKPALAVYRQTANGSERLADGDVARKGDLLLVGYVSGGRAYGVILSIDGRGVVTQHLPPTGGQAVALSPPKEGKPILLKQAYELDDAPKAERFYFVTGANTFAVAPVMDAARRAAKAGPPPDALALPAGLEQISFAVQKEGRQ